MGAHSQSILSSDSSGFPIRALKIGRLMWQVAATDAKVAAVGADAEKSDGRAGQLLKSLLVRKCNSLLRKKSDSK